jgi:hypothetical protein
MTLDHTECGATSEEVPGFGRLICELPPGHDGPHREREDGHVWEEDDR